MPRAGIWRQSSVGVASTTNARDPDPVRRTAILGLALVQLAGCAHTERNATSLVVGGIAAMGASLVALRRGPYGPGDYVMTLGLFAALYGTAIYPHDR